MNGEGAMVLAGLMNIALVLLLAPLMEGLARKVTAWIQSRQGPPIRQAYLDLLKLLGKEDIESGSIPTMQHFSACLALGSILFVALLVPMGHEAPFAGRADIILLVYALTLAGIATLLGGLAAGSTYSVMGVSREMMAMLTLEPLLAITVVVAAVYSGSLELGSVLNGSVYASNSVPVGGLILLGIVLFSLQAFVGRMPFDTTEAETEIMEGPMMEYSGPKLALFKYARMAKLFVYSALFISLFVPWGRTGFYPLDLGIFVVKVFVVVMFVTVVAATHARYRIDQAVRYYIGLLGLAFVAAISAVNGY